LTRYLCGGEALKGYRQVSRTQLALASADIGYFEPKAANLSVDVERFSSATNYLLSHGLTRGSVCHTNCFIRKTEDSAQYRYEDIWIGKTKKKAKYIPPKAVEVESLMDEWFNRVNQDKLSLEEIFELYAQFLLIHPFADGNGRTLRVIIQYLFRKHTIENFPPDLYRLKNLRKGSFVEQIQSYSNSNPKEHDTLFFDDWIAWEKRCRRRVKESLVNTANQIERKLLLTPPNSIQAKILDLIGDQPILSENFLMKELKLDKTNIMNALSFLKEKGILEEKKVKAVPGVPIFIAPHILTLWHCLDDLIFDKLKE
jgi:Fic family protein